MLSEGPILITGVTGFAGRYLAQLLCSRGQHVIGLARTQPDSPLPPSIEFVPCDLTDRDRLEQLLARWTPRQVYHLAGFASAAESLRKPELAWQGNLHATLALLDGLARHGKPRLVHVSTGMVYGPGNSVLTEESPLLPDTPYAASKAAAEMACLAAGQAQGLDIVRVRPFNHFGPGQASHYAISNFARQLVAIERGLAPPVVEAGNLDTHRDFTDVRDVVSAYVILMAHGSPGRVYNLASGQSLSMRDLLRRMADLMGLDIQIASRADLLRPTEPDAVRVDVGRVTQEVGWHREFSLEQSLADVVTAWRNQE